MDIPIDFSIDSFKKIFSLLWPWASFLGIHFFVSWRIIKASPLVSLLGFGIASIWLCACWAIVLPSSKIFLETLSLYSLLDWPGIRGSILTQYFLSTNKNLIAFSVFVVIDALVMVIFSKSKKPENSHLKIGAASCLVSVLFCLFIIFYKDAGASTAEPLFLQVVFMAAFCFKSFSVLVPKEKEMAGLAPYQRIANVTDQNENREVEDRNSRYKSSRDEAFPDAGG